MAAHADASSRQFLTRREVSEQYPISYSTLAHFAVEGRGPRYTIIGKRAVYRRQDVEDWITNPEPPPCPASSSAVPAPIRKRGRPAKPPVKDAARVGR